MRYVLFFICYIKLRVRGWLCIPSYWGDGILEWPERGNQCGTGNSLQSVHTKAEIDAIIFDSRGWVGKVSPWADKILKNYYISGNQCSGINAKLILQF